MLKSLWITINADPSKKAGQVAQIKKDHFPDFFSINLHIKILFLLGLNPGS